MKTTVELPDTDLREAKALAAKRGISMKTFLSEALREKLQRSGKKDIEEEKPWMKSFGKLSDISEETKRIMAEIDAEFGQIDPEDIE